MDTACFICASWDTEIVNYNLVSGFNKDKIADDFCFALGIPNSFFATELKTSSLCFSCIFMLKDVSEVANSFRAASSKFQYMKSKLIDTIKNAQIDSVSQDTPKTKNFQSDVLKEMFVKSKAHYRFRDKIIKRLGNSEHQSTNNSLLELTFPRISSTPISVKPRAHSRNASTVSDSEENNTIPKSVVPASISSKVNGTPNIHQRSLTIPTKTPKDRIEMFKKQAKKERWANIFQDTRLQREKKRRSDKTKNKSSKVSPKSTVKNSSSNSSNEHLPRKCSADRSIPKPSASIVPISKAPQTSLQETQVVEIPNTGTSSIPSLSSSVIIISSRSSAVSKSPIKSTPKYPKPLKDQTKISTSSPRPTSAKKDTYESSGSATNSLRELWLEAISRLPLGVRRKTFAGGNFKLVKSIVIDRKVEERNISAYMKKLEKPCGVGKKKKTKEVEGDVDSEVKIPKRKEKCIHCDMFFVGLLSHIRRAHPTKVSGSF